jgi:DNA-binding NarL/FixJ family response regulator
MISGSNSPGLKFTEAIEDAAPPLVEPAASERHDEKASNAKRVLIVDDHPLFRHGIADLINAEADLKTCGEADSAPHALEAIRKLRPDLVIVDISLKGTNGIELVKSIRTEHPKLPVLMLSMHDESLYALRALRAGARGYVMKQEALERVMSAIHRVLGGEVYVSPVMSGKMINEFVGGASAEKPLTDKLTDRELEVLQLIGEGLGIQQIAQRLNLSAKTIETHRAHLKEKLNMKSARDLTHFAVHWVEHHVV